MNAKTNDCRNCGQRFTWEAPSNRGRYRQFCDRCVKTVKRDKAADRKRRQRSRQKENEVGKTSVDPVVVGYGHNTPAGSSRQAPAKKTTRQTSETPLSLGRGSGQRPELGSTWNSDKHVREFAEMVRRVDQMCGPLGFFYDWYYTR